ncbi:hypothetical protein [Pedobacter steynii]
MDFKNPKHLNIALQASVLPVIGAYDFFEAGLYFAGTAMVLPFFIIAAYMILFKHK